MTGKRQSDRSEPQANYHKARMRTRVRQYIRPKVQVWLGLRGHERLQWREREVECEWRCHRTDNRIACRVLNSEIQRCQNRDIACALAAKSLARLSLRSADDRNQMSRPCMNHTAAWS